MSENGRRLRTTPSARCIYTGIELDPNDPDACPSHEHIVPMSLGGSNQFVTDDVARKANNRAGQEIDNAVASLLPYLILRQKYGLRGHRGGVPDVTMRGRFCDLEVEAVARFTASGEIEFDLKDEHRTQGRLIEIGGTEERVKFLVSQRLKQAKSKGLSLVTKAGDIRDQEDVDIALMLETRQEGKQFEAELAIDLRDFNFAVARLSLKIALGLGHRVLGSKWSRGAGAHRLRMDLFRKPSDPSIAKIRGQVSMELHPDLKAVLGVYPDHHIFAVVPGKITTAIIALFGGELGTSVIPLGSDSRRHFEREAKKGQPLQAVLAIPLHHEGSRPLLRRTWEEIAASSAAASLVSDSKATQRIRRIRRRLR